MKTITRFLLSSAVLICTASASVRAQGGLAGVGQLKEQVAKLSAFEADPSISPEVRELNRGFLAERRAQLRSALQARLGALRRYRDSAAGALTPAEAAVVAETIRGLEKDLLELFGEGARGTAAAGKLSRDVAPARAPQTQPPLTNGPCVRNDPTDFCLGAPTHRATDRPLELTLGWTQPQKPVDKYVVEISEDPTFGSLLISPPTTPSPRTRMSPAANSA